MTAGVAVALILLVLAIAVVGGMLHARSTRRGSAPTQQVEFLGGWRPAAEEPARPRPARPRPARVSDPDRGAVHITIRTVDPTARCLYTGNEVARCSCPKHRT